MLQRDSGPTPGAQAARVGVLEEVGSDLGVLGARPRPWPCGGTSPGCDPNPALPSLLAFPEPDLADALGTEVVLEWAPKPAQTPILLPSTPLGVARRTPKR